MNNQVIIARRKLLLGATTLAAGSALGSGSLIIAPFTSAPAEAQTAPLETSGGLLPSWRDGAAK
jgi:hypothetical protein